MSPPVSRVLSWTIIFLGCLLPDTSRDLPESTAGHRIALCSVLLRMGFTWSLSVTRKAVSSYLTFAPLPQKTRNRVFAAVYFCCTFLGVASTGRYPASCPGELGLSSQAAFQLLPARSSGELIYSFFVGHRLDKRAFYYTIRVRRLQECSTNNSCVIAQGGGDNLGHRYLLAENVAGDLLADGL